MLMIKIMRMVTIEDKLVVAVMWVQLMMRIRMRNIIDNEDEDDNNDDVDDSHLHV